MRHSACVSDDPSSTVNVASVTTARQAFVVGALHYGQVRAEPPYVRSRDARGCGVGADGSRVRFTRRWPPVITVAVLLAGLAGCTGTPSESSRSTALGTAGPAPAASVSATFVSVVDGDTIKSSAGTVRLIGIDTPERGECGHDEATAAIERLLSPGGPVALELPAGQNDVDRHGRLVRYVTTVSGVDLGLMQLEAGNAVARYDSTDGYPAHPRESAYRAAQTATRGPDGAVVTAACQNKPQPSAAGSPVGRWWELYQSCGQLRKNTAGHPVGPFHRDDPAEAEVYEWFAQGTGNNGDGDGDGLACE